MTALFLPAGLMFIMFSLGIGLSLADFARVFRYPRAFAVGVFCHFILLPLVAYLVVRAWGVTGALAVGFMIIAACPTGTTSNLLTYYARGDVALALSFTAVAGLVSILTVPAIIAFALQHFMGASAAIDFPAAQVMLQIFIVMGLPVAAGMLLRARNPDAAMRWQPRLGTLSALVFVAIIAASVFKHWALFAAHALPLSPLVFSINIGMLLLGLGLSLLAKVSLRQATTVAIEASVQNGALAIVIASTLLGNDTMMLPGAIYGTLMYVSGVIFVFIIRRFSPPLTIQEEAAARAAMH